MAETVVSASGVAGITAIAPTSAYMPARFAVTRATAVSPGNLKRPMIGANKAPISASRPVQRSSPTPREIGSISFNSMTMVRPARGNARRSTVETMDPEV